MLVRTQILFSKDVLEELRLIADEKGWSLSETVRRLIKPTVIKNRTKKMSAVEVMLKMAKNAYRGKVPKDLGSNDEYLYGKLAPDYPFRKKKRK